MTVEQLIDRLKSLPPTAQVVHIDNCDPDEPYGKREELTDLWMCGDDTVELDFT